MKNIACLILNYNDADTTVKLLQLISKYDSVQIVLIVDNCSTDNSFKTLSKFQNNKIHLIRTAKNGGYGYGNNYGIRYLYNMNINYIIVANPDVEFSEELIIQMYKVLDSDLNVGIVSAVPVDKDNIIMPFAWKKPDHVIHEILNNFFIYRKFFGDKTIYSKSIFVNKKYFVVDSVPGSLLMLNSKIMINCGMYDEGIFLYGEEKVLGYKLKSKNIKTIVLLDRYYKHYHSVTIKKNIKSVLKNAKISCQSEFYILKNYWNIKGFNLYIVKIILFCVWIERIILSTLKKCLVNLFYFKNKF